MSAIRTVTRIVLLMLLAGCASQPNTPEVTVTPELVDEITIANFEDGFPQEILDAFTAEYGVKVNYVTFQMYEELVELVRAGQAIDVAWVIAPTVGLMLDEGLLAEIDYQHVPNMRNIAANFRDLAYDPQNAHSVPFTWGTTGLLANPKYFGAPVTSWNDLWKNDAGKVGVWLEPRSLIGIALRSLGYSANTADSDELQAALEHLIDLQENVLFVDDIVSYSCSEVIVDGTISAAFGWAYDGLSAQEIDPEITYVMPEEGTLLWVENMVIPATTKAKYTAEVFIDFVLRPEVAAMYTNQLKYALANSAAQQFIDPGILNNPVIYPTDDMLENAELLMPLKPDVQARYDDLWGQFMAAMGRDANGQLLAPLAPTADAAASS